MSQLSPPLRIALIAAIAFLGVWALFLRPEPLPPVESDAMAPTAQSAPGAAEPSSAAAAAADANASVAAADAAAGALDPTRATAPATGATAAPPIAEPRAGAIEPDPETLAALPRDVARAVRGNQVVALLFWDPQAADDRRVRRALRSAARFDSRVFVSVAPVAEISEYAPITRGVDVAQTPTIVVVDRDLHAESLVGYVARTTIRQALSDAIRASR